MASTKYKPRDLTQRQCRRCGNLFSGFGQRRYCSVECSSANVVEARRKVIACAECVGCGQSFTLTGTRKRRPRKWCSEACRVKLYYKRRRLAAGPSGPRKQHEPRDLTP